MGIPDIFSRDIFRQGPQNLTFSTPPLPPLRGGTPRTTKFLGKGDLCHSKDLKNAKMGAFDKGEGGVGGSPPVAISGMPTHAPQSTGIFGRLLTLHTLYQTILLITEFI